MKYIILFSFLYSCNYNHPLDKIKPDKDSTYQNNNLENTIGDIASKDTMLINQSMEIILRFPEVKEIADQIEKKSRGKHSVSMIVQDGFEGDSSLYTLQVGDNSKDDRYVTIYNFILEKNTGQIKICDPITDSVLTLKEWRVKQSSLNLSAQ